MRSLSRLSAVAAVLLVTGCSTVVPPPEPAPVAPRPAPPPPPAPSPHVGDWRDWPLSAGNWNYSGGAAGSTATFGAGDLTLRCYGGSVEVVRRGAAGPVTVRTTSLTRTVPGQALAANDGLLDAMGYSRGRFVVEAAGTPVLVVPAWSEILRVVEDCRS